MKQENTKPRHKDIWTYQYSGLVVEITHHSAGELINDGKGVWCYYIYIHEGKCKPGVFANLWLEDKVSKWYESSPERVTHDYNDILPDCEWHGGITYYAKHGHSLGHRCVQAGCDFSHLWDHDQGYDYTLDDIVHEANRTARLVASFVCPSSVTEK